MRSVGRNTLEVNNTDGYDHVCTVFVFCSLFHLRQGLHVHSSNPNECSRVAVTIFQPIFRKVLLQYTHSKIIYFNHVNLIKKIHTIPI